MSIKSKVYFEDLKDGAVDDQLNAVGELILLANKKRNPDLMKEISSSALFWKSLKLYIETLDLDKKGKHHNLYIAPLPIHRKVDIDVALQFFTELISNAETQTPLSIQDWTSMANNPCFEKIVLLARDKGFINVEAKNLGLISRNKNNDGHIESMINNGLITADTLKKDKIETFNFLTNLAENQMTHSLFAALKKGLLTPDVTIFDNGSDSLFHWTTMDKSLFLFNFNALCKGAITPEIARLQDNNSKDTIWHIAMENDMNPMFIERAMINGVITKEIMSIKNSDGVTLLDLFAQSEDTKLFEKAKELDLIPQKYLLEMSKKPSKPQKKLVLKDAPKKIVNAGHDSRKLGNNKRGERQYRR